MVFTLAAIACALPLPGVATDAHPIHTHAATASDASAAADRGARIPPAGQFTAKKSVDLFLRPSSAVEAVERVRRNPTSVGDGQTDEHDAAGCCEAHSRSAAILIGKRLFETADALPTITKRLSRRPRDPPKT